MKYDVAKRNCLIDGAGLCKRAKALDEVFQFLRMTRREEHRMTGLDPKLADRAADMAGADNADFHLGASGRLTQGGCRSEHPLQHERSRSAE